MEEARGPSRTSHARWRLGKGAHLPSVKVPPRLPLPPPEPSWPPPSPPTRGGQGKARGPGGTPPPPGPRGATPPHSLSLQVIYSGCWAAAAPGAARGQPLRPACRQGVTAVYRPAPFARAVAPQFGERRLRKGGGGRGWGCGHSTEWLRWVSPGA